MPIVKQFGLFSEDSRTILLQEGYSIASDGELVLGYTLENKMQCPHVIIPSEGELPLEVRRDIFNMFLPTPITCPSSVFYWGMSQPTLQISVLGKLNNLYSSKQRWYFSAFESISSVRNKMAKSNLIPLVIYNVGMRDYKNIVEYVALASEIGTNLILIGVDNFPKFLGCSIRMNNPIINNEQLDRTGTIGGRYFYNLLHNNVATEKAVIRHRERMRIKHEQT